MSNPILPTVGRVVHYCPAGTEGQDRPIFAAVIAAVHSDECVTLHVFDGNGYGWPSACVYHQDAPRLSDEAYWQWMPYQIGQAAKTEQTAADLVAAEVARQLDAALERLQHNVATPGGES